MKWSEMTPEQRNRLVHEKVMGIDPAIPCSGTFVTNPHDGHETLYCPKCDAGIFFGDSKTHKQPLVPAYTTDMNAAWLAVERITQPPTKPLEINAPKAIFAHWWAHGVDLWAMKGGEAAEAICITALRVHGVSIEE